MAATLRIRRASRAMLTYYNVSHSNSLGGSLLSIGEVSALTGLSDHVLRKYEREGLLLRPVTRDSAGRRLYDPIDVEWLRNCVRFRESGMPLAEIRRYVDLVKQGDGNERGRIGILRQHRVRLQEQRAAIDAALALTDRKIAIYEEHVDSGAPAAPWSETVEADEPSAATG